MAQVASDTNDESTPLMPIHARYRWFYPIDWPQLSAVIRFRRAQGKCEGCGRPAATEKGHHLERQLNPSPGRSPAGAPARDDASGLGKDPRPFAGEAHL